MTEEPIITEGEITSDDKLWAALGYAIVIVAIIVLLMEDKKDRPFLKFHAVQSIVANVAFAILATIISVVTIGFGGLCIPIFWLVFLYWAYKAYEGEYVEIPVVTNFIKNQGWV